MTKWISCTEAAAKYGYSRMWINTLIHNKRITAKRVGSFWVVDDDSVKRYKETMQAR